MTTRTVYVPRLIESAEQAEALPVGTIAILDDDSLPVSLNVTKTAEYLMPWRNGRNVGADENVVGAWALVPIEAEEETLERQRFSQAVPDVLHRYTTPWTLYTPQEPK